MRIIIFCPDTVTTNGLKERYLEDYLASCFQCKILSLALRQDLTTDTELFDLVCESDGVAYGVTKENLIWARTATVLAIAKSLKKPIYQVRSDLILHLLKEEDETER